MTIAGGSPGEVLREYRRDARVEHHVGLGRRAEVARFEPLHLGVGEEEALPEQVSRAAPRAHVGGGVDQQLQRRCGAAVAGAQLRDDGREVGARAVTADTHARWVRAEALGVLVRPRERRSGVFDGRRERVLGGESVVDGEHVGTRGAAQQPAQRVVGHEVPEDEAATVEVRRAWVAARARPGARNGVRRARR